jgi:hypothetical protein
MRRAWALVLLAAAATPAAGSPITPSGCGVCHGEQRVEHATSIHAEANVDCVSCHGGDPSQIESKDAAHAAAANFRGKLSRAEVPEVCGTCHADVGRMRPFALRTDVLAVYRTSHHGQAVLEGGRSDAAVCTDCHGTHGVLRTNDARSPAYRVNVPETCGRCHGNADLMAAHDLDTAPPAEFADSVHGRRLSEGMPGVPSCAGCHDAHAASPPGATEVADVCGNCHVETRDRFRESPHAAASLSGAMEQCVTCHGNHSVGHAGFDRFDTVSDEDDGDDGAGARCLDCHDGDRGEEVARAFGAGFREAEALLRAATRDIDAMAAEGFYADDERESLARAERELVRAVPLSHTVDLARIQGSLRRVQSLVDEALIGREKRLREARDRRIFGSLAGGLLMGIAWFMAIWRRKVRPA